METQERVAAVLRLYGAETNNEGSVVWALALRVVQAENELEEAASEVKAAVSLNSLRAASGEALPAVARVPFGEVGERALQYETALVRLQGRHEALRTVAASVGLWRPAAGAPHGESGTTA